MRLGIGLGLVQPVIRLAGGILGLLNIQKLSLTVTTPIGKKVAVTDGFQVGGATPDNGYASAVGMWVELGTLNGRGQYGLIGTTLSVDDQIWWSGDSWYIFRGGFGLAHSSDDVAYPWLVTTWVIDEGITSLPTLTHPAIQQHTAPSTALGGVFVSGGTQDGVYTLGTGTSFGRAWYGFLGNYDVADLNTASIYRTGVRWEFWVPNSASGDLTYYSLSDVATPDLVPNTSGPGGWKNASDDSPASITVASVTRGQLVSGRKLGDVTYQVSGVQNGRNLLRDVLVVAPDLGWDGTKWTDGTTSGTGNTPFPDIGIADPVAAEENWENVVP